MRYPTRNGLVIPPLELGFSLVEPRRGVTTNHHSYWEREAYRTTRWRSVFRNLVTNVTPLPVIEHVSLHEKYTPPVMPKDTLMIDVIEEQLAQDGVINCVFEQKTNRTYQIEPEAWVQIKGLYRSAA